jgi:hypothetical protein
MIHPLLTKEEEEKLISRFWSRTNKAGPNECWEWNGYTNAPKDGTGGYGFIKIGVRSPKAPMQYRAHRLSWAIHYGSMPPKPLYVCHTCDNKKCVNINHLWAGLHKHNLEDAARKGKMWIKGPMKKEARIRKRKLIRELWANPEYREKTTQAVRAGKLRKKEERLRSQMSLLDQSNKP